MLGFEHLKSLHKDDEDFKELYESCQAHPKGDFSIHEGCLFKGNRLCVLRCGTRELILREVQGGSFAGHFGEDKTYIMAKKQYFWPHVLKEFKTKSRDVPFIKLLKGVYFLKDFTPHCLLLKDHG